MLSIPRMEEQENQNSPEILSPSTSRRSNDPNSPEFEFWMVRNPTCPQPDLHSADELFSGGILLPLHLLHPHQSSAQQNDPPPPPPPPTPLEAGGGEEEAEPPPGSSRPEQLTSALTNLSPSAFTSSKRWRDIIFKKSDRNNSRNGGEDGCKEKDKLKKKERKKKSTAGNVTSGVGNGGVTAAELNINIWPFRRSRSAGNGGIRPRTAAAMAASTRKVSSAPCSRSNSAGESKSRKWPSSPNRGGVHLGRNSPVFQVRRVGSRNSNTAVKSAEKAVQKEENATVKSAEEGVVKEGNETRRRNAATGGGGGASKARVLNINVPPMCMGYRQHLSCRSDGIRATSTAAGGGGESGGAISSELTRGSNIFNIRSLFTKKVY